MPAKDYQKLQKNYSITELLLCRLDINIGSFSHLLKRVDFDAIIDHLSLTHIIKSKAEPATIRIKRLLTFITLYSFNLYYIKGKDMVLSDFLSRQINDGIILMKLYLFLLTCIKYYKKIIIIWKII